MKKIMQSVFLLSILVLAGCISQQSVSNKAKYKLGYKIQAGASYGGITENTELKQIPTTQADAYTGATQTGFNTGVKVLFPVKHNVMETGIDYMHSNQTFTYQDDVNGYTGKRKLGTSQFMVPLTYNIGMFRKKYEEGLLTLKLGYLIQYSFLNINDITGNLPEYKLKNFSKGFTLGFATSPFHFNTGSKLGFYVDFYRGSRIYEDFYNQKDFKMPGTSFIKYGISFQF